MLTHDVDCRLLNIGEDKAMNCDDVEQIRGALLGPAVAIADADEMPAGTAWYRTSEEQTP